MRQGRPEVMALRELFAKFTFDFDQATINRVTQASQVAEGKVAQLAAKFTGAGAAATQAAVPLRAINSAMGEDTISTNRLARAIEIVDRKLTRMGETLQGAFVGGTGANKATQQLNQVAAAESKVSHGAGGMKAAFGQALAAFGIFGGVLGSVFAGHAIKEGIANEIEMAAEFDPLSRKTGIAAEALQALGAYAKHSDVDFEVLTGSLTQLTKNVGLFAAGAPSRIKGVFKTLKIGVKDVRGMAPEDIFWKIGKGIAGIADPTQKLAFAQRVFGESGALMLEMFHGTAEEIEQQKQLFTDLGVVYSKTFVEKADKAEKKMHLLGVQFHRVKVELIAGLLPALMWGASKLTAFGVAVAKIAERTRIFQAAFVTGGWLLFSKVLARIVTGGGGVLGWLKKLWPLLARMARVLVPWLAWTLILDDIMVFLQGGDSALGRLLDRIGGAGSAKATLEDIKQKISDLADWASKAAIAIGEWLSAIRAWASGSSDSATAVQEAFGGMWSIVKGFMLSWQMLAGDTSDETQAAFLRATQPIENAFTALGEFFGFLWTDIKTGAAAAINAVVDAVLALPARLGGKVWKFLTGESEAAWRNKVGLAPDVAPVPQPGDRNYPHVRIPQAVDVVPPMLARPTSGTGSVATLHDNRQVTVNVSAHDSPAKVGHAVAGAVQGVQPAGPNLKALHGALAGAPNG